MRKEKIINELKKVGFDLVGISNLDLEEYKYRYLESIEHGYYNPLIKGQAQDRLSPEIYLAGVKSVIVVGITYSKESPLINNENIAFGNSSWGRDYHAVIKTKAQKVMDLYPEIKYKILVDNHALDDRLMAYKAGLGFFGKNSLLINPELGSYFFIGLILIDQLLEADEAIANDCGECKRCIKACPNQAINKTGYLNSLRCRSYLTQKKGDLTDQEQLMIGNSVFGCDICAKVCPYNNKNHTHNAYFLPSGIEVLNYEINLSNKEFKLKYGHLSGSYIGKARINRNFNYIKKLKSCYNFIGDRNEEV